MVSPVLGLSFSPILPTNKAGLEILGRWENTTSTPWSSSVSEHHGGYNVTNFCALTLPLEARTAEHPGRYNLTGIPFNMTNTSLPIVPVQGKGLEDHGFYNITDDMTSNLSDAFVSTLLLQDRAAEDHGRYNLSNILFNTTDNSVPILFVKSKGMQNHGLHNITVNSSAPIYHGARGVTASSSNFSAPIYHRGNNVHNIQARSPEPLLPGYYIDETASKSSKPSQPILPTKPMEVRSHGLCLNVTLPQCNIVTERTPQHQSVEDTETRIVIHVPSKVSEAEEEEKWNEAQ